MILNRIPLFIRRHHWLGLLLALLWLPSLACDVPGDVELPIGGPPPTATPPGDTISYKLPLYTTSLAPGETVPGTQLTYVEPNAGAYQVSINGQSATRRLGDSFIWDGVLAPGVYGNYNLRITRELRGELPVTGPVELVVFNPVPIATDGPPTENIHLDYSGILVNYLAPVGREIPGTTMTFVGVRQQGEGDQTIQQVELSGISGYNLFAIGDSLVWHGRLRDNVAVSYDMRVTGINENGLRLTGEVDLFILQP